MNANTLKNQFIKFLRAYGILGEFMRNFEEKSAFSSIVEMFDAVKHKDAVKACFKWSETKEGYEFWNRYHQIWSNTNPARFCSKPDDYMVTHPVGAVIKHEELGELVVTVVKSSCVGCAFYQKNRECTNGKHYACTPYSRGDRNNVIFKKKC